MYSFALLNLIGVFIAFVIVIVLIRRQFDFGLSLITGSLIIGLFSLPSIGVWGIVRAIIEATIYSFEEGALATQTLELAVLMTLIYMLAKMMQNTKAIAKLINSLRTFFSKGGTIGVVPAIYGLMPVPGGALFSAPVVKEEGDEFNINVNKKNFFNIWFRHVWFPIYPISSNVIILCSLAAIDMPSLILANFLSFVVMIDIGYVLLTLFVYNGNKKVKKDDVSKSKKDYTGLVYILPPIVPLMFAIFYFMFKIPLIRCFIAGVFFSIALLLFLTKTDRRDYKKLLKKSFTWKLAVVIAGIMIFREMFEASGANVSIFELIKGLPIPAVLMVVLLPVVLGLVTGYLLCAITLSYPLLEPFLQDIGLTKVGFTSLIFMSAFVGYIISPIHLCNVLSSKYLKTDTTRMYHIFIPSALLLLAFHILIIYILFHI
ncbi:MAG: DUF401 family protein [Candidatus Thermoplasmatota archaeon]|nr:DUF401 family protein [Candidatus Thermoplasmatota archaeon]